MPPLSDTCPSFDVAQTKAHLKGIVHLLHHADRQCAQLANEPSPIDRPDLVEEHNRGGSHSSLARLYKYLGGIEGLIELRRDCRHDRDRTMAIGYVVLHHYRRPRLPDLPPDRSIETDEGHV